MGKKAFEHKDYYKALEYLQKAADMGNVAAYSMLGGMYFNGEGVGKDYQKALEYSQKAAKAGVAEAYFNLGVMYYQGKV
nr:hypothetical protein [Helicobacter suis]